VTILLAEELIHLLSPPHLGRGIPFGRPQPSRAEAISRAALGIATQRTGDQPALSHLGHRSVDRKVALTERRDSRRSFGETTEIPMHARGDRRLSKLGKHDETATRA